MGQESQKAGAVAISEYGKHDRGMTAVMGIVSGRHFPREIHCVGDALGSRKGQGTVFAYEQSNPDAVIINWAFATA